MDPLPPSFRLFWPIVEIIAYYICSRLPYSYLKKVEERLKHNGVNYLMIPEEFVALRLFSAIVFFLVGFFFITLLVQRDILLCTLMPIIGFYYPSIWVRSLRQRQIDETLRTLPAYLDFITMALQAGLNFSAAIDLARSKGPVSPLRHEFGIVLRDIRSGIPRVKAFRRMADRLDMQEINSFVSAIIQAEKMGSSMSKVLKIQAEQRRNERFQRAEKKAMEAPVKLLLPLVLFIFPTTFLVLAFPIAMKFMAEGGLF
jgi:tight adherence protein C